MKKRFGTILLTICLLFVLCLTAAAAQTMPLDGENMLFLFAADAQNMQTNNLQAGFEDAITLQLHFNVDEKTDFPFLLEYDNVNFTLEAVTVVDADGQFSLLWTENDNGTISFTYKYHKDGEKTGLMNIATLRFKNKAAVSNTVYDFSLTDGSEALCDGVRVTVDHRHSFGSWSEVSLSENGTIRKEKRTCQHCSFSETRTVDVVDYSISLKEGATRVKYNENKQLLYAIAPGATVGSLLDKLTSAGNMQVVDKNGAGMSREDALATGMTLLVMDDGDGMDGDVQFTAAISVLGDVDQDGGVSAGDARIALRYAVALENSLNAAQVAAIDTESDNNISSSDARFILRVSVGLEAFYGVKVTSVKLSQSSLSLKVGQTATLSATLAPADATIRTISWKSGNSAVVSVSGGVVTAKGVGTATITATANSGASASCVITVTNPVTAVTRNRNSFYLVEGKTRDLKKSYSITPAGAETTGTKWTSSNTAFTVTDGVVSCNSTYDSLSNKSATITVTFPGGVKTTFTVTLLPAGVSCCQFNYENLQVNVGQQFKLTGSIVGASSLKLVSDNTAVLTVGDDNVITAVGPGTANLTCDGVDYSEKVTVTVKSKSIRIISMAVNSGDNDLVVGVKNTHTENLTKIQLVVEGYDTNGHLLTTKNCSINDMAAGAQKNYVWKTIWGDMAVTSAKITKIVLTHENGRTEIIPAGCWHTGA